MVWYLRWMRWLLGYRYVAVTFMFTDYADGQLGRRYVLSFARKTWLWRKAIDFGVRAHGNAALDYVLISGGRWVDSLTVNDKLVVSNAPVEFFSPPAYALRLYVRAGDTMSLQLRLR